MPTPTVSSRHLRRHVVRIDDLDGRLRGTGFFVAPGLVLTCAHVVANLEQASIRPDGSVSVRPVTAAVEFRSPPPAGRELWPLPDLAVLRLHEPLDHPAVRLHDRPDEDPAHDVSCHAYGFPKPEGAAVSFRFEGVDGDGFLRLKDGQSAPGLSGAPLVCPRRRAVVGVITATRNPDTDLGGWASPVAAWLTGTPGLPAELTGHGPEPAGWAAVVPSATTTPPPRPGPGELRLEQITEEYLTGLSAEQAAALRRVNRAGLRSLRRLLVGGDLVALLGPQTAMPLYPSWSRIVADLIDAAAERGLDEAAAATFRSWAQRRPEQVVELLQQRLGRSVYLAVLRDVLRPRRDPESGRTWTPVQELICRMPLRGVVTTTFDPGIVDARVRIRPYASSTGFSSWSENAALHRWRTGEAFADDELPVLFAHGHHNQPDAVVLTEADYRHAYAGPLADVLRGLLERDHVVWLGFSVDDQRIATILREAAAPRRPHADETAPPRHVAVLAWDPAGGEDPELIRQATTHLYDADVVLYPSRDGAQDALAVLLEALTDARLEPAGAPPAQPAPAEVAAAGAAGAVHWQHGAQPARFFTGRVEELARLTRWADDPEVRLIAVNAWGGAGKTALVTHWIESRPSPVPVFGWSFYADRSAENWARQLLAWAGEPAPRSPAAATAAVRGLLRTRQMTLVLDGLEVLQEGPGSDSYGQLLDGPLREVLTAACRIEHKTLIVLTSRFPFADLQYFDGAAARVLDVPPFTPAEGAVLLAEAAPGALTVQQQHDLVAGVDGHAMATAAMAALLADDPDADVAEQLYARLATGGSTSQKIGRVLSFYGDRLTPAQRHLTAIVSLFTRPVTVEQILAVAQHPELREHLAGWSAYQIQAAVRGPLAGLLSWHREGTVSAHPLIRETFRPLALGAARVAVDTNLMGLPDGTVATVEDGLRVVEAVELSIDAEQWQSARDVYTRRTDDGRAWNDLPAVRLGQRAALAFVGTPARQDSCRVALGRRSLCFFLNAVGLFAMNSGNMPLATAHLREAADGLQALDERRGLSVPLQNLAECLGWQGRTQNGISLAREALRHARETGNEAEIGLVYGHLGWLTHQAGDTIAAEQYFKEADLRIGLDDHMVSLAGVQWGHLLMRTGRTVAARHLNEENLAFCDRNGWNRDVARCRLLAARIDLAEGEITDAQDDIDAAVATFRAGDCTVELAEALVTAAECARRRGDFDNARVHAEEALGIAAPRGLVPIHADALTAKALIAADRCKATGELSFALVGHDDADAAIRRAAGPNPLPWAELDAVEAHAALDRAGRDRSTGISQDDWERRATELRRRLVPAGLDPDPLATVESERSRRAGRRQRA